jgi:hypothetical protein
MKRFSIVGVMLTAILAMAAMGATSAMATVAELPEFLKNVPDTFTGAGAGGKLRSLAKELIECEKYTIEGEVTNGSHGKINHLDFKGCKALGFAGNSLGDLSGIILVDAVPFESCYIKEGKGTELEAGLYLEKISVHIEVPASGQLVNVEGSLIAKAEPINTLTKKFTLKSEQKEKAEGDAKFTTCKLAKNTLKAELTSSSDTKHEKRTDSSLEQTIEVTFLKEHELDG